MVGNICRLIFQCILPSSARFGYAVRRIFRFHGDSEDSGPPQMIMCFITLEAIAVDSDIHLGNESDHQHQKRSREREKQVGREADSLTPLS